MQYVSLGLSILSAVFVALTFFFNRNNDTKKNSKEEKEEAKTTQYKWGVMETKLDNVSKQVDKILDKLDSTDKETDEKITKAIMDHERRFHNKWGWYKMSLRDRVVEMKEELEKIKKMNQENSLAMELLADKKRTIRILGAIIALLIIAFVGTNIYWIAKTMSFETASTETEQVIEDIDNSQDSTYTQQID